jgi:hypothetical protein
MIYIMKIHANLYKCAISFKNEKFMQKRVNILDSQSFKFVFGDGPNQSGPLFPTKQIQSFEMHHN